MPFTQEQEAAWRDALRIIDSGVSLETGDECLNIARRSLLLDNLPNGAIARYECTGDCTCACWDAVAGAVEIREGMPEAVFRTFPLSARSKVVGGNYHQAFSQVVRELLAKENDIFFQLLRASVHEYHIGLSTESEPQLNQVNQMLCSIEEHELIGAKLLVSPHTWQNMRRAWGDGFIGERADNAPKGVVGHVYSCDIHVTSACEEDEMLVLAPAPFVGPFAIRTPPYPIISGEGDEEHVILDEEITMAIIHTYATAATQMSVPQDEYDAIMAQRNEEANQGFPTARTIISRELAEQLNLL